MNGVKQITIQQIRHLMQTANITVADIEHVQENNNGTRYARLRARAGAWKDKDDIDAVEYQNKMRDELEPHG